MVLGLTGGIGCGKSTAARIFAEFGFTRVDADEWVRERILPSPPVLNAIRERFGPGVIGSDGRVDRTKLGPAVFGDPAALQWLEEQIHPRLFEAWRELLADRRSERWVFEVPLLFETGLENWFDFTLCVATTSAHQLARLAERGMSKALAEQRISRQLPLAQKIEFADIVILNDGSLDFLREQIERVIQGLDGRV